MPIDCCRPYNGLNARQLLAVDPMPTLIDSLLHLSPSRRALQGALTLGGICNESSPLSMPCRASIGTSIEVWSTTLTRLYRDLPKAASHKVMTCDLLRSTLNS